MRKYSLTIIFLLITNILKAQDANVITPAAYGSDVIKNYIRTLDVLAPQSNPDLILSTSSNGVRQITQYFDGLGRPLQTVQKGGSLATNAAPRDLILPIVYDEFGREVRKYLPFAATDATGNFKLNPFQQQQSFYQNQSSAAGETFYYGKTEYEASPLNRVNKLFAPGDSWVNQDRGTAMKYWTNTVVDAVRIWMVTDVTNDWGTYTTSSTYVAGELYKTVTVDENGKQLIEFKDKEGQVVLRKMQLASNVTDDGLGKSHTGWLCTYYIYDDQNRLRAVIQPKGVERLAANSWNVNAESGTILIQQFFRYEYDGRNLMIRKKTPGYVENRMVYDARDRLVLTQDRRLNASHKWMYTKYDDLNRPIETGALNDEAHYNDHSWHQVQAYNNTAYPVLSNFTNVEVLTKTFYDNYDWRSGESYPLNGSYQTIHNASLRAASTLVFPYSETPVQSIAVKGMVTGTKMKIYGTSTYVYSIPFYDVKGRVIQMQSTNITGGTDITTTQYSFSGQPLTIVHQTQKSGNPNPQTHTIKTLMDYDMLGRLSTIKKQVTSTINGQAVTKAEQLIVTHKYDALGQLIKKIPGTGMLEDIDYTYNIRGWLTSINKDFVAGGNNHSFGMELGYNKTTSVGDAATSAALQYNGNISRSSWRSKGDGIARQYDYSYDNLNRLTGAPFLQNTTGSTWDNTTVDFSVSNLDYDANGNIMHMNQMGIKPTQSTPVQIDQLTYNYIYNSNQLRNVIDAVNDPGTVLGDFRASANYTAWLAPAGKNSNTDDFVYDANGNLARDRNKDIGSDTQYDIGYNYMNLANTVTFRNPDKTEKGKIQYQHDAAGNKVKKIVTETGQPTKTTLYLNGLVFENDVLQFIPHEEGRIRFTPAVGSIVAKFDYDYFLKDHLGNVRMVLTEEEQEATYPAATLEGSLDMDGSPNAAYKEKDYYSIDLANIVDKPSGVTALDYANNNGNGSAPYNPNPNSATTATSAKMYQLQATGGTGAKAAMGLGITIKVMSGDKINIFGKSYYQVDNTSATNHGLPLVDLLTGLLGGPSGIGTAKGLSATGLSVITPIASALETYLSHPDRGTGTTPKAYINYLFLDEQFRYAGGGFSRVGAVGTLKDADHHMELQDIQVPKNGYLYVYCSNESPVQVFFDNLQVVHTKGPILEETHYYPFGLIISGISSKIPGVIENKKGYNGNELQNKELSDGSGLEMYDFNARTFDQQIGRFIQIDPLVESGEQESLSPYHFSKNNPVRYNDPDGKCPTCLVGALVGAAVDYGSQVAANLVEGRSLGESLTQISGRSIFISTVAGALTGGVSAFIPKGVAGKLVVEGATTAIDVGESVLKQYADDKPVSFKQTAIDVLSNKIGGKIGDNVGLNSSSTIKTTEKQLNRAERIAAGDPTSSGRAATVKKLENQLTVQNGVNQAAKETVSGTTANVLQAGLNATNGTNKVSLPLNHIPVKGDNTLIKKPLYPSFKERQ